MGISRLYMHGILLLVLDSCHISTTGDGDWASVLLEPAIAMGPASFVEFVILGQPSNVKKQNMLFGISVRTTDLSLLLMLRVV